jgi:hypothetical protein
VRQILYSPAANNEDLDATPWLRPLILSNEGVMNNKNNASAHDTRNPRTRRALGPTMRVACVFGLILFFFYTVLAMREFTRSNSIAGRDLFDAVAHSFTFTNFGIGIICALIGCAVVEFLWRSR